MWRLCKLGYRHEPRLLRRGVRAVAAGGAARRAARAVAEAARRRRARRRPRRWSLVAAVGLGAVGHRHLVPAASSTRGCSAASATRSPSRSRRTSPGCRRRSPPSRTTSGPSTSTASRCCATRCSCSTTCTCRCSRRCGWILRLGVTRRRCSCRSHPALALLALFALPTVLTSTWRPARRARGRGARRAVRAAWPATCSRPPRPRRPARRCGSPASGRRLAAERRAAWERWYGPIGRARWRSALPGTRWRGPCSAPATSARSCSSPPGSTRRPATCCWCWRPASRLSAYIGATVGEIGFLRGIWMDGSRRLAWLEDYAAALGRHGRPAGARPPARRHPRSSTCRSPTRAPTGWCWTTSSLHAAGRLGRRDRRRERRRQDARWSSCCASCTSRPSGGSWSTAPPLAACPPTTGATRLAGAFQDFFRFELRARHTVGVGDVPAPRRRAGGDRRGRPGRAPPTWSSRLADGPRHPARPDLAGRRRGLASASGRSSPWPAASCATSRCCWCSTSRPPRSTPRPSTPCSSGTPPPPGGTASRPHHDPGVAPVLHRAHGRPDRGARRRPGGRGRHPRRADGPGRPVRRAYGIQAAAYR